MGFLIFFVAVIYPNLFGSNKNNSPIASLGLPPTATLDPMISAMSPQWKNANSQITLSLYEAREDSFYLALVFKNLASSAQTVTLLSSDISVSDNLGNKYTPAESTRTIRDEVGKVSSQTYRFSYKGAILPEVTELLVHISQINEEKNLDFKIAIPPLSNQLEVQYKISSYSDKSIQFNGTIQNNAAYNFLVRFKASDITLKDDAGNTYVLDADNAKYKASRLVTPGYGMEDRELFSPGVDPRAKTMSLVVPIMGKQFAQTFDLGVASDKVRYEAKIQYQNSDSFSISLIIFNLGDKDLVARYDVNRIIVSSQAGQSYPPEESQKRKVYVVRSGGQETTTLYFKGKLSNTNGLTMTIPVLSATENIKISIAAK
jgi:hypothetical protein